jgi:hypothetical protein
MGVTSKIWGALTSMIKLEDKVTRQSDAIKSQQAQIEEMNERLIRLEAQFELIAQAAFSRRLKRD